MDQNHDSEGYSYRNEWRTPKKRIIVNSFLEQSTIHQFSYVHPKLGVHKHFRVWFVFFVSGHKLLIRL